MAKQKRWPITITIFLIFLMSVTISPLGNKKHREENVTLDEYYNLDGVPSASFQRDGLPMNPGTGDQLYPKMCPDGEGGIITIWLSSDEDLIYAQRTNVAGDQLWGSGKTIPVTGGFIEMTSDENGGAYIIWRDENLYVKAQRIDQDGNEVWTSGGIDVFNQGDYCADLELVSDSQGGVIIGWGDSRSEAYGMQNFYAQRINSTGDAQWTANGTAVIEAAEQQIKLRMIADGTGNTYFAWEDGRNDPEYDDWRDDIYAQKLDIDGNQLWGVSGIAVCHANHRQVGVSLSLATGGGIYFAWMDYRTESSYDIYMQFLNSAGAANGRPMELCSVILPTSCITPE